MTEGILRGIMTYRGDSETTRVFSDGPAIYGEGTTPGAAMLAYAKCLADVNNIRARYACIASVDAGDGHETPDDGYEVR